MLTASFTCFAGISEAAEQRLWREGILNWNDFIRAPIRCLSARKAADVRRQIGEAIVMRDAGLLDYFAPRFPAAHRARLLTSAAGRVAGVDIETTGLDRRARITTIAVALQDRVSVFVADDELAAAMAMIADCQLVVTYNGARFDIPMLERHFKMRFPRPHIDLCPVLAALGLRGGLKACERAVGLRRTSTHPVDGSEAVTLWEAWNTTRNVEALTRLILYNAQDACSLRHLSAYAAHASMQAYPLPIPRTPLVL